MDDEYETAARWLRMSTAAILLLWDVPVLSTLHLNLSNQWLVDIGFSSENQRGGYITSGPYGANRHGILLE